MRPESLKTLFMTVLLVAASQSALAQWKWKDANGKLQYSDLPPPANVPEKDVLQRPPGQRVTVVQVISPASAAAAAASSAAAASAAAASQALQDQQARAKREQEQQAAARNKAEQERQNQVRADNCRRAQEQLRLIDYGTRLTSLNDKGEQVVLDDQQRASERARAQEIANKDCR